jgi:hypothetical protein|tara:strand:- start:439 stop:1806 length:1368 start_codon:yes stop_codon:yes gene_type:complete
MEIKAKYLVQPLWKGTPDYPHHRDILTPPDSTYTPGLALGIGIHDQLLEDNFLTTNDTDKIKRTWVKTFWDRKKLKDFIQEADDTVDSIVINIGWHLWPHLDYNTGNELNNMSAELEVCRNYKEKVKWRFANGWDLHNLDEMKRYEWFNTQLQYIEEKNIIMNFCNYEMVQFYQSRYPNADISWDPIYFQRMVTRNIDFKFRPNVSTRTKHTICLNNFAKTHRTKIYKHLTENNYSDKCHLSYLKPPGWNNKVNLEGIRPKTLMSENESVTNCSRTNIGDWQDSPPFKFVNDAYTYIATETLFSNEIIEGQLDGEIAEHYKNLPGQATFITEKTFKSFMFRLPMLVVGTPRTLKTIRANGFKTFPEFFNEAYDDVIDSDHRMRLIIQNIDNLMKMSIEELHKLYWSKEIQQKLDHNQNLFYKFAKNYSGNQYDNRISNEAYLGYNTLFDRIYYDK